MARCIYLVVGGMALVLIVVWPTAICVGSELKMSIPNVQHVKFAVDFSHLVVTGSIADRPHDAVASPIASRTKPTL